MVVALQQLNKKNIRVKIRGITPLLIEKMSMDVVEAYNKRKGQKIVKKDTRLEEEKVEEKIHRTEDGNVGFPSTGFHKGMIEVAPYLDGLNKKLVRGSVRFVDNLIPVNFKKRKNNLAWGRDSGTTRAPRKIVRPEFQKWTCELKIDYNASNISAEQIINLLNWAGFQMGIGSWRPEKGGVYGQYEVITK